MDGRDRAYRSWPSSSASEEDSWESPRSSVLRGERRGGQGARAGRCRRPPSASSCARTEERRRRRRGRMRPSSTSRMMRGSAAGERAPWAGGERGSRKMRRKGRASIATAAPAAWATTPEGTTEHTWTEEERWRSASPGRQGARRCEDTERTPAEGGRGEGDGRARPSTLERREEAKREREASSVSSKAKSEIGERERGHAVARCR